MDTKHLMQVYLGTGGFHQPDWVGLLYPIPHRAERDLSDYAQAFDVVEINTTFYGIPKPSVLLQMWQRSGERLKFCVKLHQSMSHQLNLDEQLLLQWHQALAPLQATGALVAVLIQFPYSFARTPEHRRYLAQLTQALSSYPLAIEFRHISWHVQSVQQAFSQQGLIWVSVDYPQLAGMPISDLICTTRTGYLRLHGRNDATWWEGQSAAERHDYRYTADELAQWADRIAAHQHDFDQLYILFENTTKGHALHNIPMLRQLLRERGISFNTQLDDQPTTLAMRNHGASEQGSLFD